jgi:Xaa-Pro dipeptidase
VAAAPPTSAYAARLARAGARMRERDVDLLFLPPSADLEYLTGVPLPRPFWAGDGDVFRLVEADGGFVAPEGEVALTYAESVWSRAVRAHLDRWEARTIEDDWPLWRLHAPGRVVELFRAAAASLVGEPERIAIGDWTPLRQLELLREACPGAELVAAGDLVTGLRRHKDADEVARMAAAQRATRRAFEATLAHVRPGIAAGALVDELTDQLLRQGADAIAFPPDLFAVGPQVALAYGGEGSSWRDVRLTAPCAVCVDMSGVFDGYCSDFARTVFLGEPEQRQADALAVVRAAQQAAVDALRPGVAGEDVDGAARRVVDAAGLGAAFWTGAGHGIGLQLHEPPALIHGTTEPVLAAMVLAVEVGTWIDGEVGAFVEDLVVVEAEGARWLDESDGEYVVE